MTQRISEGQLRRVIDVLNNDLAKRKIDAAFSLLPRNGMCAVDWYKPTRRLAGFSGVAANVEVGTVRECHDATHRKYTVWIIEASTTASVPT